MAVEMNNLSSIQAYQKSAGLDHANTDNQGRRALGQPEQANQANQPDLPEQASLQATQATIRTERQASLVAHLFGDGKSASADSLKLTYQAAIEKINEVLSAQFGISEGEGDTAPISKEALKTQGGMEYWTPENTAKRIVDGSTAFLTGFQAANPELKGEALMDRFMDVIGGGIAQGFDEAKGLLGDLDVLKGDIATNIESTFKLVQEGLQNFRNQYLGTTETAVPVTDTAKTKTDTTNLGNV
ncbi:DUF5610 domain-containing protein [Thiomicrorhabdus arctica]|uniref:DUF5610 domain-containing protein n=1 Tax=Thiomicrorhabdus arctica TaxID=131540 RepID=UPI00035C169F|nr:DUF5610 domain-containing protein [Thiomicrorhabdus arctica]